jgi:hypothetical protein
MKDVTVTLTLDDIKLYDLARAIGLPSIVISMYGDRIKKLLAEERQSEREACAKVCEEYANGLERNYSEIIAAAIRARGQA